MNLLTAKQVCELFGISKFTLYRWLKAGRIPGAMVGGHWLFREEALKQMILEQEEKTLGQGKEADG